MIKIVIIYQKIASFEEHYKHTNLVRTELCIDAKDGESQRSQSQ